MNIANAPCSWGILEFGLEGNTNGYRQMLDEMAGTGYQGTELGDWGYLPTEPDTLKEELESRMLKLVGAFVPVNFKNPNDHQAGLSAALKTARLLADVHPDDAVLVLADENGKNPDRTRHAGRIRPEHSLSEPEWNSFIHGVDCIAETVKKETGITSVFHHHCAGYVETPDEIRILMDRTDPELVGLCFDTGHFAFGGGDPVKGLTEHYDRIHHVHFKDFDPEIAAVSAKNGWGYFESIEHGIFSELGTGSVDFEAIRQQLLRNGYEGWIVVEQDVLPGMGAPRESADRNRRYLRDIGL